MPWLLLFLDFSPKYFSTTPPRRPSPEELNTGGFLFPASPIFMKFDKQVTSITSQITLLTERGMIVECDELASRWLQTVGYYRLSAYWLPYERPPTEGQTRSKQFKDGTCFEQIIDLYVFDRRLRLLVLEAIERIEIATRAGWVQAMTIEYGAHAHIMPECFASGWKHVQMLAKISNRLEDSSEVFIRHYTTKYSEPYSPPLWAVTELMTFGDLSKWVEATKRPQILSQLARDVGLPTKEVLTGVLHVLSYVRNVCAHHNRLWNRSIVKPLPKIKRFRTDLVCEQDSEQLSKRLYNVLVVLTHMMRHQAPDTTYPNRLCTLLETRNQGQLKAMGFPDDWRSRNVWSTTS